AHEGEKDRFQAAPLPGHGRHELVGGFEHEGVVGAVIAPQKSQEAQGRSLRAGKRRAGRNLWRGVSLAALEGGPCVVLFPSVGARLGRNARGLRHGGPDLRGEGRREVARGAHRAQNKRLAPSVQDAVRSPCFPLWRRLWKLSSVRRSFPPPPSCAWPRR